MWSDVLVQILRRHLAPYKSPIAWVVLLQLVGTIAGLFLPALNADIIDNGVAKADVGYVWRTSLVMLAASLVQVVCSVGAVWFGARTAMGLGRDLREAVLRRVMSFSSREVGQFGAPSLITRNTNDVQQIQQLVLMSAFVLVAAPMMLIGGVIMALRQDVGLSWLVAVAVPVLVGALVLIISRMVPLFRVNQVRIDNVNRVLREQISGVRVIRAFVREDHERERFAHANAELTDTGLRVGRLMVLMFPIVTLVMNGSTVAVVWFGSLRVDSGEMLIGSVFAYISYLIQILMSVMMATMVASMVPRASVSAERIGAVLETSTSVTAPASPIAPAEVGGLLEFENVEFSYPGADAPVLCDITFTARPGTVTAIIGSTGAGKTTLVNLMPRLVDPTGGTIRLDGVDLRDLAPESLWSRVGIVPQKPYLFRGTVASNLRFGNPRATDEQLWAALRIAQADDFVSAMSAGLAAPISQGGTNVSGGQRQRLCIARAIVARPELYIFDDSFSALDLATDARLRAALEPETRDATVVIVAQRISTIIDADQILVVEAGRVVGLGRHDELLVTCPTYAEIVESQVLVGAVGGGE